MKSQSILVKHQARVIGIPEWSENGQTYRGRVTLRFDDACGNGHNTFSITGEVDRLHRGRWGEDSGGCIHELIAARMPEFAPLIKWHLCSSDGPLHYIANTVFLAGDRDCWGLRAGEFRRFVDKEGRPAWRVPYGERTAHSHERPAAIEWEPWGRTGEGKARELAAARRAAIWPDATDEELTAPGLADRLAARLPALLDEFRAAIESIGFTY